MSHEKRSHWTVHYTIPVESASGRNYQHNHNSHVLATTIDRAIAEVRRVHPAATVWGVNHHGVIEHEAPPTEAPPCD